MRLPTFIACVLTASIPAWAQTDYWVDSASGSDSNPGTSPAAPFRTISFAAQLPDAQIHVLPGTYSEATGEAYPIQLLGQDSVVGVAGPDSTLLELFSDDPYLRLFDCRGQSSLRDLRIVQRSDVTSGVSVQSPLAELDNLWFEGGSKGVYLSDGNARVTNCRFSSQSLVAVMVRETSSLEMYDSVVSSGFAGVVASATNSGVAISVLVERCSIRNLHGFATGAGATADQGSTSFVIRDSLLADCSGRGMYTFSQSSYAHSVAIDGTTIVNCGPHGLQAGPEDDWTIRNSIIAGHTVQDVDAAGAMDHCLTSDGSGPAGTGNRMGNPLFVDAPAGDYRLGWGSPAIDSAAPTSTPTDQLGRPRTVDGDHDLSPHADMGALEHQTLTGPGAIQLGQAFELGVTGPSGGFSTVGVSHLGHGAAVTSTPYGNLVIEPAGAYRLTPVLTLGVMPSTVQVPAFTDPALAGTSTGFQALTRSTVAPAGGAFSQALLVRIE